MNNPNAKSEKRPHTSTSTADELAETVEPDEPEQPPFDPPSGSSWW